MFPSEARAILASDGGCMDRGAGKVGNGTPGKSDLNHLALVAHELSSPLSTIFTTVETLRGGYFGPVSDGQRNALETVLRNCQYLEDTIRCFLDLSAAEMNGQAFSAVPIKLVGEVIQPVLAIPEYRDNLKKMPLALTSVCDPVVCGDVRLLRIVVNNLLNNAIKYGRQASTVNLEVSCENGMSILRVCNEGVAIPADDRDRLFQPFVRLRQPGSEGVKGSGLGLYLCRQIVEQHQGTITFHDDDPRFVEFRVVLPMLES